MKINQHRENFRWLENILFSDDESDETNDDQEYRPSPISAISSTSAQSTINIDKEKRTALNSFIQLMRPERATYPLLVTRSYNQLNKKSKRNFRSSTKFIVDAVVEFLAGDYANVVLRDLYLGESRKSKQYKIFYCCDYNMIFYCRKE